MGVQTLTQLKGLLTNWKDSEARSRNTLSMPSVSPSLGEQETGEGSATARLGIADIYRGEEGQYFYMGN